MHGPLFLYARRRHPQTRTSALVTPPLQYPDIPPPNLSLIVNEPNGSLSTMFVRPRHLPPSALVVLPSHTATLYHHPRSSNSSRPRPRPRQHLIPPPRQTHTRPPPVRICAGVRRALYSMTLRWTRGSWVSGRTWTRHRGTLPRRILRWS